MRIQISRLSGKKAKGKPKSDDVTTKQFRFPVTKQPIEEEMTMNVSPICEKDGVKYAFVRFSSGDNYCEWKIPEATLSENRGFTEEQLSGLGLYVKSNMTQLKKMAAQINIFEAFKKG